MIKAPPFVKLIHSKNNLKETFDVLDELYNLKELEDNVLSTF